MRSILKHRFAAAAVLLGAALSLVLFATPAFAEFPWPTSQGQPHPNAYEQYCHSDTMPNDYTGNSVWKYSSEKETGNPWIGWLEQQNDPLSKEILKKELYGVTGASVDKAWGITTGRPDVIIAVLDSGIFWGEGDLVNKFHLNEGELPLPDGHTEYDWNHDGVFNIKDYEGTGVPDANGNLMLDPEDLIWTYSDGIDGDNNGYTDDICGWDFFEDDNDPLDEMGYGHGTGEAHDSGNEANNGSGLPGTCPNAMILPVRVGDSFIADVNEFAQGVIFGVDSGASVIQEALGGLNSTSLGQAAIDYAYSRGTVVMASAADEESGHHNYPCNYERTVQVNSVTKYESGSITQWPPSYLYFAGCTNFGEHTIVSIPSTSCSSEATGRSSGMAALLYSAAKDEVARGHMSNYPGLDKPLSACEAKQLVAMNADDIDLSPGFLDNGYTAFFLNLDLGGVLTIGLPLSLLFGRTYRFHSTPGWDPYFGYGRINIFNSVKAVNEGRIPPEAEIKYPLWCQHIDPSQGTLEVRGRVAAVRADSYQYTVEYAPGWNPQEGDWIQVKSSNDNVAPVNGVLATLDLSEVNEVVKSTMDARGGKDDPTRFTFTIRARVQDNKGNKGEDRKTSYCYHDPDAYPGAPYRVGSDGFASPKFADLDDDGIDELIVANSDGMVHAYNSDFSEVPGWPVHSTPLPLHTGSAGFSSGILPTAAYGSILSAPAVGDMDHNGTLEVVITDMEGRVHAWDKNGNLLPGFPVRTNPMYSSPERADWWTPGALPDPNYFANRFAPDKIHRLNDKNRLDKAIVAAPALYNLDNSPDHSLEIITSCTDQHLYAWYSDGTPVAGWPVKLVDPIKVTSMDPATHRCEFITSGETPYQGSKIVAGPSVSDIDGDGDVEVVCGTNECYREPINISSDTLNLGILSSLLGSAGINMGNTRLYTVNPDGTNHSGSPAPNGVPSNAYKQGWPVKVGMVEAETLPDVCEGINSAAAMGDIDGDGKMDIGVASAAGPGIVLEPDGSSHFGLGRDGLYKALVSLVGNVHILPGIPDPQAFVMCDLGGPSFARLGNSGHYSFVSPSMNLVRALDIQLAEKQERSHDSVSVWDTTNGDITFQAPFPKNVNDMMFFATPGAADINGDGSQELTIGTSYYDFHAFNGSGNEPANWPKFTGGWMAGTAPVGDFDGDGKREIAMTNREGWLFVWRTRSKPGDMGDWPQYAHDLHNTNCLATDADRPGRVMDLKANAGTGSVKLSWTAPGDDGAVGTAKSYEVRYSSSPLDQNNWASGTPLAGVPKPAEGGTHQEMVIDNLPYGTYYFAIQAIDDAGNPSAVSNTATATLSEEVVIQPTPVPTWYLAEGSTAGGMETWVLVQNPNDSEAEVELTYITPAGAIPGPREKIPANSRKTYEVAKTVPDTWEVSTKVTSDKEVIAERAMYGNGRTWGTDSIGVTAPATTWYLAEGSTAGGMETWVLVQNPNDKEADVSLTYMTPSGARPGPREKIPANSRKTYEVAKTVPDTWEVSTKVTSENGVGVTAERAMYGNGRTWAHDSVGTATISKNWYLAEGSTAGGMETWVLVQNPNDSEAEVELTYITPAGAIPGPREKIPANSRKTYEVAKTVPDTWEVSTKVTSDKEVIAERAMYGNGRTWGTDSIGVTAPATTWYLAEGSTAGGMETWVLVQNPNDKEADVSLTYMTPSGARPGPREKIPANSRKTYEVAKTVPDTWEVSTKVTSENGVGVTAERAMYGNGRTWAHDSVGASEMFSITTVTKSSTR
jgi:hypothetical protein